MFNNIFNNNLVCKLINYVVKFYYEYGIIGDKNLKYSENLSLDYSEAKKNIFFQSFAGDKIDCK